jgi:autotransporter-associated beta strand protein
MKMLGRGQSGGADLSAIRFKKLRYRGRILAAAIGALGAAQFANAQVGWTGAGPDDFWSTGLNWSTGVTPGATDNVFFGDADSQTAPGIVNNVVSSDLTIGTLSYSNLATVGYHTTQINSGTTLTLNYTGSTTGNVLSVGTGNGTVKDAQVITTMLGGGNLALTGANGIMVIRQGVNNALTSGTQTAVLDMRGLTNFNADINRIVIGAEGTTDNSTANNPNGTLYLAQNNIITTHNTSDGVVVGDASTNPSTNISALYLGQTNVINTARMRIGNRKSSGLLTFQSGLVDPTFTLRGTAGGATRAAALTVGDNGVLTGTTAFNAVGVADLRGGKVDVLTDQLIVGRGFNSAGSNTGAGDGTLSFDNGTIDANLVLIGYQFNSGGNAVGTVNIGAAATLTANTQFSMARKLSSSQIPTATLNVDGGTIRTFVGISDDGGVSTINLNSGTIDFKPGTGAATSLGSAVNPIDNLVLNGTLANLKDGFVGSISGNGSISNLTGTFTVDNSADQTFDGSVAGTGGLDKTNTALLTLTGNLTYTGATTVHAGTLVLGGAATLANSTTIDVRSGATLDVSGAGGLAVGTGKTLTGSGTVIGPISATAGGKITPGGLSNAGTLTFNNGLTLDAASLAYDLSGDPSTIGSGVNDLLSVGGDLSLSGVNTVALSALMGTLTNGTYRLIDYSGSLTGDASNLAVGGNANGSRRSFAFDTSTAGQVNLIVTGNDALSLIWKGNGTTNRWNINGDANWNDNTEKFFNLDNVTFDDTGSTSPAVELVGDLAPGSINVNASGDYTFTGAGRLTGGASLTKDGGGKLTIANTGVNDFIGPITINSGTVEVGDGGATGSLGAGAITNNGVLSFNRSDDMTAANAISGFGTLEKHGAGILNLTGDSSFNGEVTIYGGTLRPGLASSLGDVSGGSIVIKSGGTLDVNSLGFAAKTLQVEGAGAGGAGAIVNNGATDQINALSNVNLTGDTTFGGLSRWDIRQINGLGALNANGFNLTKTGPNRVSLVNLAETNLGDVMINDGTLGFEGTTTEGDPTKTITLGATGTLALNNTITAPLVKNIVSNGGRLLTENGTIVHDGQILLNADTTLEGAGGSITYSGVISGSGGLIKNGTADVSITGMNTYTGGTTVNAGFIRGSADSLQGNFIINATGAGTGVVYQNTADGVSRATFTGAGNLLAGTALGTNVVTLALPNSYEGFTALNAGVFRVANNMALGGTSVGTYLDGGTRTGQLQLSNDVTVTGEYLGMIGRGSGNTAAHLLNFSGNNTWAGNVAAALATESINATGVGSFYTLESAAGNLTISGDVVNNIAGAPGTALAHLQLQGESTGVITGSIGGTAPGSWSVIKSGNGTWTLASAANAYTASTIVNGGTLKVTGSIASSSDVTVNAGAYEAASVQSVKALNVNDGAQALISAGVLKVGDNVNPAPFNLTSAGKVDLTNRGLAIDVPAGSETTTLQSVRGQIISAFNTGGAAWQGNGITSSTAATNTSAAIGYAIASEVLPFNSGDSDTFLGATVDKDTVLARYTLGGDATLDGTVDFNDLVKLAQNYNTTVSDSTESWWTHGDFTYDGITDFNDLVKLAQNYNTGLPTEQIPGASAAFEADLARAFASVPEPGTLSLLGIGGIALMGRRRRRSR